MDDSIRRILEDPQIFHYKQYWLKVPIGTIQDEILSIFSFGRYRDALTYKLRLNDPMRRKLQKLTIVSIMCNSKKNAGIPYSIFLEECGIEDVAVFEQYLIELQPLVRCRMDQVSQTINIIEWFDCRDIYCNEKPLPELSHVPMTKNDLIENLRRWRFKLQNDIL